MKGQTVQDPQGRDWIVRRRWVPRLGRETVGDRLRRRVRRARKHTKDGAEAISEASEGPLALLEVFAFAGMVFLATVGLLLLALAALLLVIPLLIVVIELVVLMLLVVVGVVVRLVFRQPWVIEVIEHDPDGTDDGGWRTWEVAGWRASEARLDDLATRLSAGADLQEL